MQNIRSKVFACFFIATLSGACVANFYDTGFSNINPNKRDNVIVNQSFSNVTDRLSSYMAQQGMFNLKGSNQQPNTFVAKPSSFGQIASATIWINEGRSVAKYKEYFLCRNDAPISVGAGTIYVIETKAQTEVQYISSVASAALKKNITMADAFNKDAIDGNCSIKPGFANALLKDAGVI